MNCYLRDLSSRQNRPVTAAEVHLYLCAKRYFDKDIEECSLIMKAMSEGKQLNLENKQIDKIEKRHTNSDNKCKDLERELEIKYKEIDDLKKYYMNKLELQKPENFFIYQKKLALIDNTAGKLIIKYKSDLFDELIVEFKKLYEWLDNRSAILKFIDNEGSNIVIDRHEIHAVIKFFHKLNAMQCDENEEK